MKKSTGLITGLVLSVALIVPTIASASSGNDLQAFIHFLAQYFNNASLAAVVASHDNTATTSVTPPTATLTANGSHDLTINAGDSLTYAWDSTNGTVYSSDVTSAGSLCGSGPWVIDTASGSRTGTVSSLLIGCTWTLHYKVTNKTTGQTAQDSVNVTVVKAGKTVSLANGGTVAPIIVPLTPTTPLNGNTNVTPVPTSPVLSPTTPSTPISTSPVTVLPTTVKIISDDSRPGSITNIPSPLNFSASIENPLFAETYTFHWDFGDNQTLTKSFTYYGALNLDALTATHTYKNFGTYVINLYATDSKGNRFSANPINIGYSQVDNTGPLVSLTSVSVQNVFSGGLIPISFSYKNLSFGVDLYLFDTNSSKVLLDSKENVVLNSATGQKNTTYQINSSVSIGSYKIIACIEKSNPTLNGVGCTSSVPFTISSTNPPVIVSSNTGTPRTALPVSKATLALTYDSSRNESSLTGSQAIDIQAGTQDVLVAQYGAALNLKRTIGDTIYIPNGLTPGDTSYSFTSSNTISESVKDQYGNPTSVFRVKAGTTGHFTSTAVFNPQNMYSGVYTVYLPYIQVIVNGVYQQINVNGAESNAVPILGEKTTPVTTPTASPSITFISPASAPAGTHVTIYGNNLTGANTIEIGGINDQVNNIHTSGEDITAVSSSANSETFIVPNNLQAGKYNIAVSVPGVNLFSNFYPFNIASSTIPTTQPWLNITSPSANPISTITAATPLTVSWNENYNSSSIIISIYDSSGKHFYDGTFSGINGENTQTLPSWAAKLPAGQYGVAVSDHNQLDASGHPTSSGVLFNLVSSTNQSPVISSISGPTTLSTGQSGKWSIQASDPQNGSLKYSVNWGDNAIIPLISGIIQTSTFTHAYSSAGTYTPTFTVANSVGLSAASSITVQVGGTVNTLVPGCTSTVGYSSTTGASCAGSSPDPIAAAGCLPGALYSSTTGALCSTQPTTPPSTQSNFSFSLSSSNPLSMTNYVDINNGSQNIPLVSFNTALTGGTAKVTQITVLVNGSSTHPTGVHLFEGNTELGYQQVNSNSASVTFSNLFTTARSSGDTYSIKADLPANTFNGSVVTATITSVVESDDNGVSHTVGGNVIGNPQYFYHATPQLTFVSAGTTKNQNTNGSTASVDVNFNLSVTPYPGTGVAYSPAASDFTVTAKSSSGGSYTLPSKALIITPTPSNSTLAANRSYSVNLTANDSQLGAGQTVTYYLTGVSSGVRDGNGNLVTIPQAWGLDNFHTNAVSK